MGVYGVPGIENCLNLRFFLSKFRHCRVSLMSMFFKKEKIRYLKMTKSYGHVWLDLFEPYVSVEHRFLQISDREG